MRTQTKTLEYISKLYAPEDALLTEINNTLEAMKVEWQMGSVEGRMLQLFIKMRGVKTIVEIGTLAGYSAIWMARSLPKDGHIYTLEKNPEHAALARNFITRSGQGDKVTVIEGDAHAELVKLSSKAPFDMVVIDADKPSYNAYLDWAEENLRPGGLLISDNTLLFGTVHLDEPPEKPGKSTWEGMKRFNERLADKNKFESVLIPTQEGMTMSIKY